MKALETKEGIRAALDHWRAAFEEGAEVVGKLAGQDVHWHAAWGVWGVFSATRGAGGADRDWNVFGREPTAFRENMLVEINPPRQGEDQRLQGVFAVDDKGNPWVLHQGRMSIRGARITQAHFTAATGMQPVQVEFSSGASRAYHKVACLSAPPAMIQERLAAFVAQCAFARSAKDAPAQLIEPLRSVTAWERVLSPEATGEFEIGPRAASKARRRHAEVWHALVAELKSRGVQCSNDRVGQYGPDLFTFGPGPNLLFEIKSQAHAQDVFGAVGQLFMYEALLGAEYRKVLVIRQDMGIALGGPLAALDIRVVHFWYQDAVVTFDVNELNRCFNLD